MICKYRNTNYKANSADLKRISTNDFFHQSHFALSLCPPPCYLIFAAQKSEKKDVLYAIRTHFRLMIIDVNHRIKVVGAHPRVRPQWIGMGRHAGLLLLLNIKKKKIKNSIRTHFYRTIKKSGRSPPRK